MKRSAKITILSLVFVLALSFLTSYFLVPIIRDKFNRKTYSITNCLTSNLTEDMDIYDIARYYRDEMATVAVICSGTNRLNNQKLVDTTGSGVCVASNGYKTSLNGYVAKKGSYIVTNHHVINYLVNPDVKDANMYIMTEEEKFYKSELLWANKNLDVAIIYCDDVNLNYVTMKDRSIDCSKEDKLDFEPVFTIGTPYQLDYINRLTVGNIASNNSMYFNIENTIYPNGLKYNYFPSIYNSREPYTVLENLYEDAVDIALGITGGNSGGGCFDERGYLVGLATLGMSVDVTQGNQMNAMVPIYPIIQVLDKVILNKENGEDNKIFTINELKMAGMDAIEASLVKSIKIARGNTRYFLNGVLYSSDYDESFNFDEDGYYIITNTGTLDLPEGSVILSCKLNNVETQIIERNDLIYFLLKVNSGDKVTIKYKNVIEKTLEVTF